MSLYRLFKRTSLTVHYPDCAKTNSSLPKNLILNYISSLCPNSLFPPQFFINHLVLILHLHSIRFYVCFFCCSCSFCVSPFPLRLFPSRSLGPPVISPVSLGTTDICSEAEQSVIPLSYTASCSSDAVSFSLGSWQRQAWPHRGGGAGSCWPTGKTAGRTAREELESDAAASTGIQNGRTLFIVFLTLNLGIICFSLVIHISPQ